MISCAFSHQEANTLDTSLRGDETRKRKIGGPGNKESGTEKGKGNLQDDGRGSC